MAPNRKLKAATEKFLERNPWAFEFDPRQKWTSINVTN